MASHWYHCVNIWKIWPRISVKLTAILRNNCLGCGVSFRLEKFLEEYGLLKKEQWLQIKIPCLWLWEDTFLSFFASEKKRKSEVRGQRSRFSPWWVVGWGGLVTDNCCFFFGGFRFLSCSVKCLTLIQLWLSSPPVGSCILLSQQWWHFCTKSVTSTDII